MLGLEFMILFEKKITPIHYIIESFTNLSMFSTEMGTKSVPPQKTHTCPYYMTAGGSYGQSSPWANGTFTWLVPGLLILTYSFFVFLFSNRGSPKKKKKHVHTLALEWDGNGIEPKMCHPPKTENKCPSFPSKPNFDDLWCTKIVDKC